MEELAALKLSSLRKDCLAKLLVKKLKLIDTYFLVGLLKGKYAFVTEYDPNKEIEKVIIYEFVEYEEAA